MADQDSTPTPEGRPKPSSEGSTPEEQSQPRAPAGGQGKVHVDADWKAEAKAGKQRLARETASAAGAASAGAGGPGRMPPASFAVLVRTLATQAAIFLSDEKDPETGRPIRNLNLAKYNIDLLGVLEEKTRGNLDDREKRLLDRYLYDLRMAYVAATS